MPFIDTFPKETVGTSRESRCGFVLDILPSGLTDLKREIWLPRLKADGTEILVRSAQLEENESSVGKTLSVELLKFSDKAAFTSAASIDFGVGRKTGGSWDEATFQTLIAGGKVRSVRFSIAGSPQQPRDAVSVQIISAESDKLDRTSAAGLIIYDPDREQIGDADVKTIYDAEGNAYTPEVVAIPGLTLADLFQRIFVTECGFDAYHTTLPARDYPIQRYEVAMGQRFYDGLKRFIGMFYPAVKVIDDEIWITDTTIPQPSSFPAPKQITVDNVTSISSEVEKQRLDALLVRGVGLENNYDFTTFRFEYPKTADGAVRTETEQITIEYRKITSPTTNQVVGEALNIENKKSYVGGTQIDESSDVYEFDAFGRPNNRRKTAYKLLPPTYGTDNPPSLQLAAEERENFGYASHPYRSRSQYLQKREMRRSGLYAEDADNPRPDGTPFKQDLALAHRSGNVNTTQTFGTTDLFFRSETAEPLPDGQTRVRVLEIDQLTGLVVNDYQENRPGEIALQSGRPVQVTVPVFAQDGASRSLDRVEDFPIGELPLKFGLPLARRVLRMRQTKGQQVSLEHIGFDASLVKGQTISAYDRGGSSIGTFLIAGVVITFTRDGLTMSLSVRELADSTAPLAGLGSYTRTIDEGEELVFTIPVECSDDLFLRVDPSPVADLTVEAYRVVGSGPETYTDLETTPIDLSPWDGTTQEFQIRITAGSVSSVTRRQFDLITS